MKKILIDYNALVDVINGHEGAKYGRKYRKLYSMIKIAKISNLAFGRKRYHQKSFHVFNDLKSSIPSFFDSSKNNQNNRKDDQN